MALLYKVIPNQTLRYVLSKSIWNLNSRQQRNSGHAVSYRIAPTVHSKATHLGANLVGAAMWWWIIWHLWHEYEHITDIIHIF
ncbi:uncharacterized protein LOC129615659 isoform X2 [Condylostylus longicornis]|uniref:uncharacterized protein LOC129615659 isoform X2 n=1 Tax=Condylostylus longicornis TaxID=2530218 RepID=UPI00244DE531|nr:uncharacterized protein LOC129615659 isoform X2 [Condylostylus longicornis]